MRELPDGRKIQASQEDARQERLCPFVERRNIHESHNWNAKGTLAICHGLSDDELAMIRDEEQQEQQDEREAAQDDEMFMFRDPHSLVADDIAARRKRLLMGRRMDPDSQAGSDPLRDAYEAALDLAISLRGMLKERDA